MGDALSDAKVGAAQDMHPQRPTCEEGCSATPVAACVAAAIAAVKLKAMAAAPADAFKKSTHEEEQTKTTKASSSSSATWRPSARPTRRLGRRIQRPRRKVGSLDYARAVTSTTHEREQNIFNSNIFREASTYAYD